MGDPPFDAGATQLRLIDPLSAAAVRLCGGDGGEANLALASFEKSLSRVELRAVTL